MLLNFWRARPRSTSGEDETAAQLRDMERQGAHLAGLAHVCAGVLILLFSLGSLISLSADAFNTVLSSWHRGALDIPAAISVAVSTLLVLAMDTAMLYAASVLRMLATRGASEEEAGIHRAVMISAALLEAATYTYMSWLYDRPATLVLWAIVLARALAAPLYAVYLSMARPLPVSSRDIFAQAELAAGRGVLRDVTALANDSGASLDKKLRMYGAASVMHDRERQRLAELIAAVSEPDIAPAPLAIEAPRIAQEGASIPGELLAASLPPVALAERSATRGTRAGASGDPEPDPPAPGGGPGGRRPRTRRNVPTPTQGEELASGSRGAPVVRLDTRRRADAGQRSAEAHTRWIADCDRAGDILTVSPAISTRELARRLAIRPERATAIRRAVQPVRPTRAEVEADKALQAQGEEASA